MPFLMTASNLPVLVAWLCLVAAGSAHAGRPLATDDVATAEPGTCLIENWVDRGGDRRATVLTPACGVAPGLEISVDYTWAQPRADFAAEAGLGLRWAPEAWRVALPLGAVNLGLKLKLGAERAAGSGWKRGGSAAQLLATWRGEDDRLQLLGNLGMAHDHGAGASAGTLKLAAVWAAQPRLTLFAEVEANNQAARFGGAVRTAGLRAWLVPERFGLDLTASREAGNGTPTTWTFGFGWYGIGTD